MFSYKKSLNLLTHNNQLCKLIFVLSFMLVLSGTHLVLAYQKEPVRQTGLDQFDLPTESLGWVLIDRQLFWTSDTGQTWTEISPSLPTEASVEGVQFLDSAVGRVLASISNPDGSALPTFSN